MGSSQHSRFFSSEASWPHGGSPSQSTSSLFTDSWLWTQPTVSTRDRTSSYPHGVFPLEIPAITNNSTQSVSARPSGSSNQISISVAPFTSSNSATISQTQSLDLLQSHLNADGAQTQKPDPGASNSQQELHSSPPRRTRYSTSDWESYRPHIKRYYFDERKTLEDTMKILARDHAFSPSIKMYKEKFKEWGWSKYLPKATAEWMLSKARQRKSQPEKKDTVFQYGNQTWTVDRVQKNFRRTKPQRTEVAALDISTPSEITYATPPNINHSPPTIRSPRTLGLSPGRWTPAPMLSTPRLQGHLRLTWNGRTRADIEAMSREAHQLERLGHLEEAEEKFREVLAGFETLLSPTHEATSTAAYQLATFYAQHDRMNEADLVLDRMGEKFTERWGLKHKETLMHFLRVVELFNCWSRADDAVTLLYRVLDVYEKHYSGNSTATTGPNALSARDSQHQARRLRIAGGQSQVEYAFGAFAQTYDPALLQYQLGLADAHVKAKDEAAEPLLLRIIEQCEAYPEKLAQEILRARYALVDLYQQLENDQQKGVALARAQNAFWSIVNSTTEKTKSVLEISTDIAKLHVQTGHYEAAEDICQRIGSEAERTFGTDDEVTIGILIRMGKIYQDGNRWSNARPWFERALAASMTANGLESKMTQDLEAALENKHYYVPLPASEDFAAVLRSRRLG